MPRKKQSKRQITTQLESVNAKELVATSTRALRDKGYFTGPTTTPEGITARKIIAADIDKLKRAGMAEYFYLMYLFIKRCNENSLLLCLDDKIYTDSQLATLLDMQTVGAKPLSQVNGNFKPKLAPMYCAVGHRHMVLRAMMMPNRPDLGAHMAIGYSDPQDIPCSSFGVMYSSGFMNNHDGMVEYDGLDRYFYFRHKPNDVMSDFVCFFVRETPVLNVIANAFYLTKTRMSPDQYRAYFPTEWYASLIRDAQTQEEFDRATEEAASRSELVLLPHVNRSHSKTWVTRYDGQRVIILGLSNIQGLDEEDAKSIIADRKEYGLYEDEADFVSRCSGRVISRDKVDAVLHSGASIVDDSVWMQRNFQFNSSLFSRVQKPTITVKTLMDEDDLLG